MKHTKNMVYKPTTESRELFLYATNDGDLYRQMICPIIDNLKRKVAKDVFDTKKAIDAFYYASTEASRHYFRDFGYKFDVTARFTVAVEMLDYYNDEIYNY